MSTGNRRFYEALLQPVLAAAGARQVRLVTGPPASARRKSVMTRRPSDEELGRMVRNVWLAWAWGQPDPKPSWLVPWEDLDEGQRAVDIAIGRALFDHGAITALQINHEILESMT